VSNIDSLIHGFAGALTLNNLMFGLLGTILGTLVGVLPGIGPALAIALLLPITYTVSPASALIMFAAIY
jgi:putative tricarboxylic transport membrane protein